MTVAYSRHNPSPRYQALQQQYTMLHLEAEKWLGLPSEKVFPGESLFRQAARIKRLIDLTAALTILDYGSGKGLQYEAAQCQVPGVGTVPSMIEYWDVEEVRCYDPCYPKYQKLPEGRFDGVICTDVLEHCPEEDVAWVVGELFSYASRFVFANIACFPARKHLPNGENAHCTIKPVAWWRDIFAAAAGSRPELRWQVWVSSTAQRDGQNVIVEQAIGNVTG